MIMESLQLVTTEISHLALVRERPLNPARRALFRIEDMVKSEGREVIEFLSWDKIESPHKVVGVRSKGLEKWE